MNEVLTTAKEVVPLVKDFVLTVAAIVAGYVGIKGLGTWRRQLRGNTEYQLAKTLLTAIYELREAVSNVRHPFMHYSREPELAQEKLKELSEREREWHSLAQAYQKRWAPVAAAKAKIEANILEAEVVWGRDILTKAEPLNKLIGELFWALQEHLEVMHPNYRNEKPEPEEKRKRREIMYEFGDADKDEYKKQLQKLIADIECELKPHIVQHHH